MKNLKNPQHVVFKAGQQFLNTKPGRSGSKDPMTAKRFHFNELVILEFDAELLVMFGQKLNPDMEIKVETEGGDMISLPYCKRIVQNGQAKKK